MHKTLLGAIALAAMPWMATPSATVPNTPESVTITIVAPSHGQTVYDNNGSVQVRMDSQGHIPAGAKLRVLLDGKVRDILQAAPDFTLEAVERGEHTLVVELLYDTGNRVARSPPTTFYLRQASRLFPKPRT